MLEKEENKFIKENMLPLIALLNIKEEEIIGEVDKKQTSFTLPLSKENIIYNLKEITQESRTFIINQLDAFEERFNNYIEINEKEYIYYALTNKRHSDSLSRNNCNDQDNSTKYYILHKELEEISRETLDNIHFKDIVTYINSKISTIEELIYLSLLKIIISKTLYPNYYLINDLKKDLEEIFHIASIDQNIINLFFETTFDHKNIYKLLNLNRKFFSILYSHEFNTSSCTVSEKFLVIESVSKEIKKWLKKLHLVEEIKESYEKVKQHLLYEKEAPLFDYKDNRVKFLVDLIPFNEYGNFNFEIYEDIDVINDNQKNALKYFVDNSYLYIDTDGRIILRDESINKFTKFYTKFKKEDDARILENKKVFLKNWLNSSISLNKIEIENAGAPTKNETFEFINGIIKPPFEAYIGDEPYIFVSYSHKNMAEVYPIINKLYKKGFNIWYDEGISLGKDFRDTLAEKLVNCNLFISFISPHVLESKDTLKEIKFADGEGKPLIIIYLTKIESIDFSKDPGLKFRIKGKQGLIKPLIPEDLFYKKLEKEIILLMSR